jgi:uncharacterized protein YkwD
MTKITTLLISILILSSWTPATDTDWNMEILDTARNSPYLESMEKEVVLELNKVRANPQAYVDNYLKPMLKYYDGKILKVPGNIPVQTKEGKRALRECIRFLEKVSPKKEVYPSYGMTKGAYDHVKYQGKRGLLGHDGRRGSQVTDRISKYGEWDILCGENIAYGPEDARSIVISLLIDDGVRDRGHRKSLLNNKFTRIGVSVGYHKKYDTMCVITLAGSYKEN